MTQIANQLSPQGTPHMTRDPSLSNYYRQQQEMNTTARSNKTTFRTRIVQNNFRGKPVDKMTLHYMNPDVSDTRSIYQHDYTEKQGSISTRYGGFLSPQTDRIRTLQQSVENTEAKTNTVQSSNGKANGAGLQIETE